MVEGGFDGIGIWEGWGIVDCPSKGVERVASAEFGIFMHLVGGLLPHWKRDEKISLAAVVS